MCNTTEALHIKDIMTIDLDHPPCGPKHTKTCRTCAFLTSNLSYCNKYNAYFDKTSLCNNYKPRLYTLCQHRFSCGDYVPDD